MSAVSHSNQNPSPSAIATDRFSVIHTEWSDGFGGQERRILSEMAGMQARGHRQLLVTRPHARIAEAARALDIPTVTAPFSSRIDLRTIALIAHYVRTEKYQFINTHSGIDAWVGSFAARWSGARLVRTRHLDLPLKRSWHNFIHDWNDAIIACGSGMRQRLVEGCGFPPDKVFSIPTGINFEALKPDRSISEIRQSLHVAEHEFLILMLGILRDGKRHDIALQAFAALVAEGRPVRLVIAGDGPVRQRVEKFAADLGVSSHIQFLGDRTDVANLFSCADCALLTSESEGVPQAVTQGMGLGVATIATRVGGVPELISDEQSGLLIPAHDVAAAAGALRILMDDPDLRQRLGRAGQQHVLKHFSLPGMLDATEALYERLLLNSH